MAAIVQDIPLFLLQRNWNSDTDSDFNNVNNNDDDDDDDNWLQSDEKSM